MERKFFLDGMGSDIFGETFTAREAIKDDVNSYLF